MKLIKTADVVVANLPLEGLKRMKLDYESLCKIKPDIILTTASCTVYSVMFCLLVAATSDGRSRRRGN